MAAGAGVSADRREGLALLRRAIELSAAAIDRDPVQVRAQLLGRTSDASPAGVVELRRRIADRSEPPWLRPFSPGLTPAGSALSRRVGRTTDRVESVAVSPDGRTAATHVTVGEGPFLRESELVIWDLALGLERHRIPLQSDPGDGVGARTSVALSSAGGTVVTLSGPGVELRDVETGLVRATYEIGGAGKGAGALSADGRAAASWSEESLTVLDVGTGETRRLEGCLESRLAFDEHGRFVAGFSPGAGTNPFSPDFGRPRPIQVWDLATGDRVELVDPVCLDTTALAFDPYGTRVAAGGGEGEVVVWDAAGGDVLGRLRGDSREITALAFSRDGGRIFAASNRTIRVWDVASWSIFANLFGHADRIRGLRPARDVPVLVSGSWDGGVCVWELDRLGAVSIPLNPGGRSVCVARESLRVLSGSTSGSIRRHSEQRATVLTWIPESGEEIVELGAHEDTVEGVAIGADGKIGASGSYTSGEITVWDLESRRPRMRLEPPLVDHGTSGAAGMGDAFYGDQLEEAREEFVPDRVLALGLDARGTRLVAGSARGFLRAWDLADGRTLATLAGMDPRRWALATDGSLLLAIDGEEGPGAYDPMDGHLLTRLDCPSASPILALALAPDGTRALGCFADATLRIWNLETGREESAGTTPAVVERVRVDREIGTAFFLAEEGRLIAWDLRRGRPVATFDGDRPLCFLETTSDGGILAADALGAVHRLRLVRL